MSNNPYKLSDSEILKKEKISREQFKWQTKKGYTILGIGLGGFIIFATIELIALSILFPIASIAVLFLLKKRFEDKETKRIKQVLAELKKEYEIKAEQWEKEEILRQEQEEIDKAKKAEEERLQELEKQKKKEEQKKLQEAEAQKKKEEQKAKRELQKQKKEKVINIAVKDLNKIFKQFNLEELTQDEIDTVKYFLK